MECHSFYMQSNHNVCQYFQSDIIELSWILKYVQSFDPVIINTEIKAFINSSMSNTITCPMMMIDNRVI